MKYNRWTSGGGRVQFLGHEREGDGERRSGGDIFWTFDTHTCVSVPSSPVQVRFLRLVYFAFYASFEASVLSVFLLKSSFSAPTDLAGVSLSSVTSAFHSGRSRLKDIIQTTSEAFWMLRGISKVTALNHIYNLK